MVYEIENGKRKVGEIQIKTSENGMKAEVWVLQELVESVSDKVKFVNGDPMKCISAMELKKKEKKLKLVYANGESKYDFSRSFQLLLAAMVKDYPRFFEGMDDVEVNLINVDPLTPAGEENLYCPVLQDVHEKVMPFEKIGKRFDRFGSLVEGEAYEIVIDTLIGWPTV
jgi:hypothetical protein